MKLFYNNQYLGFRVAFEFQIFSWAWLLRTLNPALKRLRQEDCDS
jgi:hypothetical protein